MRYHELLKEWYTPHRGGTSAEDRGYPPNRRDAGPMNKRLWLSKMRRNTARSHMMRDTMKKWYKEYKGPSKPVFTGKETEDQKNAILDKYEDIQILAHDKGLGDIPELRLWEKEVKEKFRNGVKPVESLHTISPWADAGLPEYPDERMKKDRIRRGEGSLREPVTDRDRLHRAWDDFNESKTLNESEDDAYWFRGISKQEADEIRKGGLPKPSAVPAPMDNEVMDYLGLDDEEAQELQKEAEGQAVINVTSDEQNAEGYGDEVLWFERHLIDMDLKPYGLINIATLQRLRDSWGLRTPWDEQQ